VLRYGPQRPPPPDGLAFLAVAFPRNPPSENKKAKPSVGFAIGSPRPSPLGRCSDQLQASDPRPRLQIRHGQIAGKAGV